MGQYSWICSDTKHALLCYDTAEDKLKPNTWTKKAFMLIPKEFGGGAYVVNRNYNGYGIFYDHNNKAYDVFEVLAKWNGVEGKTANATRENGIDLYYTPYDKNKSNYARGNYNNPNVMKYPLKIVENYVPYESALPCWNDPNQGWGVYEARTSMKIRVHEKQLNEDASDELQGIDIPKGSILEDVVDWAEYTADEDGTIKDVLEELLDKGVMSGMTFLISYEDGQNFFNEHKDEINKLLGNYIYSEDDGPFTTDGWDTEDPLALTPNNQFCLAAFAFEEVARDLLDKIS